MRRRPSGQGSACAAWSVTAAMAAIRVLLYSTPARPCAERMRRVMAATIAAMVLL